MRLLALSVATATVLALAPPQTPPVLAQSHDDGAVGRTLRLDGGPPLEPENRPQIGSQNESAESSAAAASQKSQVSAEKTGEAATRGRPKTRIGWGARPRHRFAFHRRSHYVFAFHAARHRFGIHRHSRRFVAFNGPSNV